MPSPPSHPHTHRDILPPRGLPHRPSVLAPTAHPVVHYLHRMLDGSARLQQPHMPTDAIRHLGPQLARLASMPRQGEHDFARLSLTSNMLDAVGRFAGIASRCSTGNGYQTGGLRKEVITAVELMRSNLARAWRIDELVSHVALSPSQLNRLFRTQLGLSPAACLARVRADRMAELLAATSVNVSEAAMAVGWLDPSIASRAFKRRYGVSPHASRVGYNCDC